MLTRAVGWAAVGCCMLLWTVGVLAAIEPKEGEIHLFNEMDFAGWVRFLPDGENPDLTWQIGEAGEVLCTGSPYGYLRTEQPYKNYRLTLEWRWPGQAGNGGVMVHVQEGDEVWPRSIEVQLAADDAGDFWVVGGATFREHTNPERRRVPKAAQSSEKPLGEWNTIEIICAYETIEVYVNGVLQNRATEATLNAGFIALQSEGAPIEFRNLILQPIEESTASDESKTDEDEGHSAPGGD